MAWLEQVSGSSEWVSERFVVSYEQHNVWKAISFHEGFIRN